MKAARDSGEISMTQNARTTCGKKQSTTGTVGRAPHRTNCGTGLSFEVRGESVSMLTVGSGLVVELVFDGLWPRGLRHGAKGVGRRLA